MMRFSVLVYYPEDMTSHLFIKSLSADMFCKPNPIDYALITQDIPNKHLHVYINEFYMNNNFTPGDVALLKASSTYAE